MLPEFVTRWSCINGDGVCCQVLGKTIESFKHIDAKWVTASAGMVDRRGKRYKDFYRKYGTTAVCVARWINGAQRKLWCHEPYTSLLARRQHGLNPMWVMRTHAALPLLRQADADGLRHLFPLIAAFGEAPDQLKRRFGKSIWRKLAGNTFYRNMLLARTGAGVYVDVPSTVLRVLASINAPLSLCNAALNLNPTYKEAAEWLVSTGRYVEPKHGDLVDRYIVRDTIDMARTLGLTVNEKWSSARWLAEHDRMAKLSLARAYSTDPIVPEHRVQFGQYMLVRLCSAWHIAEEGRTMGHCVANYVPSVLEGEYLVYSLREHIDGPSLATVGLLRNPLGWYLEQVRGRYNAPPPVELDYDALSSLFYSLPE